MKPPIDERGTWTAALAVASACLGLIGILASDARWAGIASVGFALAVAWVAWRDRGEATPVSRGDLSAQLITVQEEERKRLSRELHDGVGQIITALKMELSRVRGAGDDADKLRLDRARSHADEALNTIRNVSRLLRPTLLDDLGLEAALEWHVEDFNRRTGMRCALSFQLPAEALQSEAVNTCIYRTVQESLNNCEKHSGASEVRVTLVEDSTDLRVTILDNGQGFAETYSGKDHFGILGMRERAHMLGGDLQVESVIGQDTKVTLNLPR